MTSRYAEGTSVSSEASRAEIERTLRKYGAAGFMYGWDADKALLGFVAQDRQIRFVLPMPSPAERRFHYTPGRGQKRTPQAAHVEWEKAVRQSWRALALVIKAKLEAVASGIVTFEEEFAVHMVLPDGSRVADHVLPGIENAYRYGGPPRLLPEIPSAGLAEITASVVE
jgi:hypothetical protein